MINSKTARDLFVEYYMLFISFMYNINNNKTKIIFNNYLIQQNCNNYVVVIEIT